MPVSAAREPPSYDKYVAGDAHFPRPVPHGPKRLWSESEIECIIGRKSVEYPWWATSETSERSAKSVLDEGVEWPCQP